MDEATASVDEKTDEDIQSMIREEFTEVLFHLLSLDDRHCDCPSIKHSNLLRQDSRTLKGGDNGVRYTTKSGQESKLFPWYVDPKDWTHLHENDN